MGALRERGNGAWKSVGKGLGAGPVHPNGRLLFKRGFDEAGTGIQKPVGASNFGPKYQKKFRPGRGPGGAMFVKGHRAMCTL